MSNISDQNNFLPLLPPQPPVSPEVAAIEKFLGPGTTSQQAMAFIQGLEKSLQGVFSSCAQSEQRANEELKNAEQG